MQGVESTRRAAKSTVPAGRNRDVQGKARTKCRGVLLEVVLLWGRDLGVAISVLIAGPLSGLGADGLEKPSIG
jgi:hypothetical protein